MVYGSFDWKGSSQKREWIIVSSLQYCFQRFSWLGSHSFDIGLLYHTQFSSVPLVKYCRCDSSSFLKLEYNNHCCPCLAFISSLITYLMGSTCHIISNPVESVMVRNRRLVKNAGLNLEEVSSYNFSKALKDWSLTQTSWEKWWSVAGILCVPNFQQLFKILL